MGSLPLEFWVAGEPKPAGSKTSGVVTRVDPATGQRVPVKRPGGGWKTFTKDSSGTPGENWRADVRRAAEQTIGPNHELVDGPMILTVVFYRLRPKTHYGSGRNASVLKPSAPVFPATQPDATKLLRALEDALTKVVWSDDSRIVDLNVRKRFGLRPGASVRIDDALAVLAIANGAQAAMPLLDGEPGPEALFSVG